MIIELMTLRPVNKKFSIPTSSHYQSLFAAFFPRLAYWT